MFAFETELIINILYNLNKYNTDTMFALIKIKQINPIKCVIIQEKYSNHGRGKLCTKQNVVQAFEIRLAGKFLINRQKNRFFIDDKFCILLKVLELRL